MFCHFPIGILGQVWYLIVSIPDLCTLNYFALVQVVNVTSVAVARVSSVALIYAAEVAVVNVAAVAIVNNAVAIPMTYQLSVRPKSVTNKLKYKDLPQASILGCIEHVYLMLRYRCVNVY